MALIYKTAVSQNLHHFWLGCKGLNLLRWVLVQVIWDQINITGGIFNTGSYPDLLQVVGHAPLQRVDQIHRLWRA